ncbi:MAG: hypothetical protein KJ067_23040 [Vicinamibacteria bacterium]|jgi:hypothetical protein|nr:hypothetical protein [Vicinamibacteria bacterium]
MLRLARCPRCGSPLEVAAARPLAPCPRCPCAVRLDDGLALDTFRPRDDDAPLRLAFYRFDRGARSPLWAAAFRCFHQASRVDLDALLTERGHRPPLVPAPLAAGVARTAEEAARLALLRQRDPGREPPRLCSLAVVRDGDQVVEPVTGWRVLASLLAPALSVEPAE